MKQKIIIGTRGSKLSLIQTKIVEDLLQTQLPETTIETVPIKTSGDKNMSPIPLDTIGKGWFTKEIDRQLLEGKIDIAVHSLKDLLDALTPGLIISSIPQREDPSEALVSQSGEKLKDLKKGAVIGTDSLRRKIQILKIRPDLIVKSVRGNVNVRLEKLDSGQYDALVLAVAGLKRLGLEERITESFPVTEFIPSPGQGALAVVTHTSNKALNDVLAKMNDNKSVIAVTAERAFSKATGGGCAMPVGAYAEINGEKLTLYGMLGSEDGKHLLKDIITGTTDDPKGLAQTLAKKLLTEAAPWYRHELEKVVVVTRDEEGNKKFTEKLKTFNIPSLAIPGISVSENLDKNDFKKYFANGASYDWIIFTSSNGVIFFIDALKKIGKNMSDLKKTKVAVVGEQTAKTAEQSGFSVSLLPKKFTAADLTKTMSDGKGKTILFPRSTIADPKIKSTLEKKGAIVVDLPIYKTELCGKPNDDFFARLKEGQIRCITFTSPSTVRGFLKTIKPAELSQTLSLQVIAIGPTTAKEAKERGFTNIVTADTHTIDGMIVKLTEGFL